MVWGIRTMMMRKHIILAGIALRPRWRVLYVLSFVGNLSAFYYIYITALLGRVVVVTESCRLLQASFPFYILWNKNKKKMLSLSIGFTVQSWKLYIVRIALIEHVFVNILTLRGKLEIRSQFLIDKANAHIFLRTEVHSHVPLFHIIQ